VNLLNRIAGILRPSPPPPPPEPTVDAPPSMVANAETNIRTQIATNYGPGLAHAYDEYRRLVEALRCEPTITTESLTQIDSKTPPDVRRLFLRIDVDADPWTGVRMARELASVGLAGNIFLLHTAPYYGYWVNGTFVRHGWMPTIVRELVLAGIEIGLHNDVMGLARVLADPLVAAKAMAEEIRWLQSLGAKIRGTVGHNSIRGQGAENSEVFVGRRLMPDELDARRSHLPIELVREDHLSLRYEGTGAIPRQVDARNLDAIADYIDESQAASIRDPNWMRTYLLENPLHDWSTDFQVWAIGAGQWGIAGQAPDGDPRFEWNVDIGRILEWVKELPIGSSTMLVLHPEYFRT
jgi:hypothetical protein